MSALRRLVAEVHRRSIWQVSSIYLVGSWGALQVVDGVTKNAGLPDWVPPFALVLLVLGLPVVLATAFVQEGVAGREAPAQDSAPPPPGHDAGVEARRGAGDGPIRGLLTWRNAILGGIAAFGLLGVAVGGYFGMRKMGVGPVASLAAQGVFDEREPVLLSDFAATGTQPELARLVTEALRVDLVESSALTVVPETYIADALRRMERPDSAPLTPEVAREIALRDGFKAVIRGAIGALGGGYVLTASLVEARSGTELAAFRETVADESSLLPAIDKLSERIRAKAGESLRQIRSGESLENVTTSSLAALEAYTDAQALAIRGREAEAIALLESALELDPEFGMAWRKLAVLLGNNFLDPERRRQAATRAYELRDRMGQIERLLAEAYYFQTEGGDQQRSIQAYEQVLEVAPDDPTALNNLATRYGPLDPERAIELLERAVNGPAATTTAYNNLIMQYWNTRRDSAALATVAQLRERYPGIRRGELLSIDLENMRGDFRAAHDGIVAILGTGTWAAPQRYSLEMELMATDAGLGRMEEARRHTRSALELSEASEEPYWELDARAQWAFTEALLGTPAAARQELARISRSEAWALGDGEGWAWSTVIGAEALSGDVAGAERDLEAWEAAVPLPQRTEPMRGAMAWARWAVELARGNSAGALAAVDHIQNEFQRCGERRCWGWWERGRALEAAGRSDEARTMYRRHLQGLALSETRWNPPQSVDALQRLAALAEAAGDSAEARASWARLAEIWADADPALQPRVQQARRRVEALDG